MGHTPAGPLGLSEVGPPWGLSGLSLIACPRAPKGIR
jgi:hypothetical protein